MSDIPGKFKFCPYCGTRLSSKFIHQRSRPYCNKCKKVIWRNPVPSAAVAVVQDSEILLIKRGTEPWKGEWSLPTGFIEVSENPREAARRELEEETSLKVEENDLEILDIISFPHPDKERVVIPVYFLPASKTRGSLKPGSDAEKALFKNPQKLERSDEKIRADYEEVIKKVLRQV